MTVSKRRVKRQGFGIAGAALCAVVQATTVQAQETANTEGGNDLLEVQVTASRVQRSGFDAPTPTTMVNADLIEQRGATNIAQVLNELPAFRGTTTSATNGVRAIFPGSNYADLRGLGQSRTLVLVDGRRFVPQITTGLPGYQVDLNQIPSLLVERAEVVTGGASAQWGSDAVAGVVNLILKKDFVGFNSEVQVGQSEEGDNEEWRVGVAGGWAFADDRLHIQAALDAVDNNGVGDTFTRDWGRDAFQIIANPCPLNAPVSAACPAGGNGQARNLILPDIRYSTATNGGLINGSTRRVGAALVPSTLLRGTMFGPGGTTSQFVYGNYVGTQNMQGGGTNQGLNFNTDVSMIPKSERQSFYSRASFDFSDTLTAFAEASYSRSEGLNTTLPPRDTAIKIYSDNAFLPEDVRNFMVANNITSFNLGRNSRDVGLQYGNVENKTPRFVVGLQGQLSEKWQWDTAYVYGRNKYEQEVENDRVIYKFRAATDAVLVNGQPVCRSSIAGATNPEGGSARPAGSPSYDPFAAGCVPLNVFGEGAPSADAINYVTDALWSNTEYTQNAAVVNLSGEPFNSWAGPVSVATGIEWREEKQTTEVDPQANLSLYESTNAKSFGGSFNVKEAYLETVFPLLSEKPFAESLELNGAVRATDYSTSGSVTTWKGGATWRPFQQLLFRGAYSRDIRAPNLYELFTPPVSTVVNVRFQNGQPAVETLTGGNPNLEPEESTTKTFGFSWSPAFADSLQVSVDYFDISIEGAIANLTSQQIADFCSAGQQALCALIQPSTNPIAQFSVLSPYLNFNVVERTGVDTAASYRLPLENVFGSLAGTVTMNFSGMYLMHNRENAGNGFVERAGQASVSPKVLATGTFTYDLASLSATAQLRYVGKSNFDNTYVEGIDINDNSVGSVTYLNLSGSYQFGDNLQVFGVVNNALDRAPAIAPNSFGLPTTAIYFDTVGRSYRVGFRYRF
jgi:outer membrane receptor protein involved in Fe transport